eukprot:c5276_g1_i1 orf=243-569(+)
MKHRRSECRDAYREGKPKPIWLDAEEWEMIRQECTDTSEKFSQQRETARVRLASVGSSHLGSGGWGNMQAEFEAAMGRPPIRAEERIGFKEGIVSLLTRLKEEGHEVD